MLDEETEVRNCDAALKALDRVIHQQSREPYEDLAAAARCVVRLRDGLIRRKRSGGESTGPLATDLDRVNSVLSVMHGCEFPLIGIRRDRIEKVRAHLAGLLGQV